MISGPYGVSFTQHVSNAAAADASGQMAWAFSLDQATSSDGQSHQMSFVMSDPQGGYYYTATGSLFGEDRTDWGGWRSYYSGAYKRTSAPTLQDDMPQQGTYSAVVVLSRDQKRIVSLIVGLKESS